MAQLNVRTVRGGRWTLRGKAAPANPGYYPTCAEALEAAESVAESATEDVQITVRDPFTGTDSPHISM